MWASFMGSFAVSAECLDRFFAIPAFREEGVPGIDVSRSQPETVHEIMRRTERWKFFRTGAADEDGKGNGVWKDLSHP